MNILKGWKTRIAAVSLFLLGTLEAIDPQLLAQAAEAFEGTFDINLRPFVLIGYAVAFYWLRQVTDTPAGRSE